MGLVQDLAKRVQGVDALVPLRWRVPFRYRAQRLVGALEPEMTLLPRLVPHDKLAVDIGGNRGTYAYALSKLAPQVVSYEPVPDCTRLLTAWSRHTPNVVIHACGLGDREDTLVLHIPRLNGSLTTTRASFSRLDGDGVDLSVPIRTLDNFGLQDVGFVKIDVEGYEFSTLQGARATIERWRPNLLIEIDAHGQSADDFARTFDLLHELGYQAHYLAGGELRPCDAGVQRMVPPVTNYIFLPSPDGRRRDLGSGLHRHHLEHRQREHQPDPVEARVGDEEPAEVPRQHQQVVRLLLEQLLLGHDRESACPA